MVDAAVLCAIGLTSGALCTLFIRRVTDAEQIGSALHSIVASLFEFRLFAHEPSVILKAQWRLITANGRLLKMLAVPCLLLVLPYWGLLEVTEGVFGRLPLKEGESTVVTVQFRNAAEIFSNVQLQASPGIIVETPSVRIRRQGQISWRVRAVKPLAGELLIRVDGRTLVKTISAEGGFRIRSEERGGTFWSFAVHPLEFPLMDQSVESIRLVYAESFQWLIWFGLASFAGALLPLLL
jgi:hypothetical protein